MSTCVFLFPCVQMHVLKEARVHPLVEYFAGSVAWRCGDKKKIKLDVIKMKPSSIICCCKATLQGLVIGDTSVLGKGTSRHACAAVHDTSSLPRGVGPQWEWQQWWCHQNRPWHVLENDARLWENCWFSRQWSMATPLQAVHNSQQHGERTSLLKKSAWLHHK